MKELINIPFFDNHTHEINYDKTFYTPTELSISFLHGFRNIPAEHFGEEDWVTDTQVKDIANFGVVKTMVHYMAERFQCEPTLEAVTECRNRLTTDGQRAYTEELYKDQNIIGAMIDSGYPLGDARTSFPCRTYQLFRMDPLLENLLQQCGSFKELKQAFLVNIEAAIIAGYAGIKCHIGEIHTLAVQYITEYEAEKSYPSALMGDQKANEIVYFALFAELLLLCQKYDTPVHIHTGCTGGSGNGLISHLDPFLLAPFLNNRAFQKTKIVLLHSSYPHVRNAALMTHMFPNVWIDMSWVLPWTALDYASILQSVLAVAPHTRILLGTGQHGIPEMAWVAAKTARSALKTVLEGAVANDLLSESQADETAKMLLYENAKRMYKF